MKKMVSYVIACMMGSLLFAGCSPRISASKKAVYFPEDKSQTFITSAEIFNSKFTFYSGSKIAASFGVRCDTAVRLPPPLPPCLPNFNKTIIFELGTKEYSKIMDGNKTIMLQTINLSKDFKKIIRKKQHIRVVLNASVKR